MVARGDLGVEAGHEKVPLIQKRILREIKLRAKPAITATQMLDSMVKNPRPTRAEVSDVANAVLDGTDAVMLSAETSVGDYPVEAVKILGTIIDEIERNENYLTEGKDRPDVSERTFSSSIADAAAEIAEDLNLAAIAVYTESGHSANLLSAQRPLANIVAFSRHERILNRAGTAVGRASPSRRMGARSGRRCRTNRARACFENNLAESGRQRRDHLRHGHGDEPLPDQRAQAAQAQGSTLAREARR
jgi:pyruvate kinase